MWQTIPEIKFGFISVEEFMKYLSFLTVQKPLNILLIDDDEVNNYLTSQLFELYDCEIKITSIQSVNKGLVFLKTKISNKENLPDVILLDLNMPGTEGWDFIEAFERIDNAFTKQVKLYIYTSSEYYKDIERAKTYSSVENILLKPLTAEMVKRICDDI